MFVAALMSLSFRPARSFSATVCHHHRISTAAKARKFSTTRLQAAISEQDEAYMTQAIQFAQAGFGNTFPNPAVGCIIVNEDSGEVLGSGFHPKAGFPHAEVFAMLEASGHIEDGVASAQSVVDGDKNSEQVEALMKQYYSDGGPEQLFGNAFEDKPFVTAYVTLEPCSHFGQTPPCATTLALAGINRVVVGVQDPNPKVDGGGCRILQEAGVQVDLVNDGADEGDGEDVDEAGLQENCENLIADFLRRIAPKPYDSDFSWMNGAKRSVLRKLAGGWKSQDSLAQVAWSGNTKVSNEDGVDALELEARWMEKLDAMLWREELVNLRLNKAVGRKKLAKRLGEKIAQALGAHVAQTVGHTALLYRPSIPAVLDLDQLVEEAKAKADQQQSEQ